MIQSDQKVGLGVACSGNVKGSGKSFIDTKLHEDGIGQDLKGGSCQNEAKVWGEVMGVECLWEALALRQGWDGTLASPNVLLVFKFYFSVHSSKSSGNLPSSRRRGGDKKPLDNKKILLENRFVSGGRGQTLELYF